jgi:hypothetical protein
VLRASPEKVQLVPLVVFHVWRAPLELSSSTRYSLTPLTAVHENGWFAVLPHLVAVPRVTVDGAEMDGQLGVVNVAVLA